MAEVSDMWAKLVENWDLIRESEDQFMFILDLQTEVRNKRAAAVPRAAAPRRPCAGPRAV
ncbi:hypothetical protein AYJ57_21270 (plasmid) [Salipiger sp. CCB-MM3]|nr:hypothetical protein AYJ57_21270 [Salipiger sp. CCB-MM3]